MVCYQCYFSLRYGITHYGTMSNLPYYEIRSIVKAFRVIEILATDREFELAGLCRLVALPKTTVHRILLTLRSLGYVEQNPLNQQYRASTKFFELGSSVVRQIAFTEIAKPFMIQLCHITGETVNLGVLSGLDIVCIEKVDSKHHLKLDQPLGSTTRAHCTAMGKSVLAYLSMEERAQLYSEYGIIPLTPKSLRTEDELEEHLREVRKRGCAFDDEEGMTGIRCVGAPVFDHAHKVVAGLSIAGPSSRMEERSMEYFARLVSETAASISRKLGLSADAQ